MSEKLPPVVVARFVVDDFRKSHPSLTADAATELQHRIETAVAAAIAEERKRCADLCRARHELWLRSVDQGVGMARAEARARSNEAHVIADAILA